MHLCCASIYLLYLFYLHASTKGQILTQKALLLGKEGWFPCTYAAPVQELATWRGRVIQVSCTSSLRSHRSSLRSRTLVAPGLMC